MSLLSFDGFFRKEGKQLLPGKQSLPAERYRHLREFSRKNKIPMGDGFLLHEALTHKSFAYESSETVLSFRRYNEKLEFLGDAVLGLVVTEYVFNVFAEVDEGTLSKVKSAVVSTKILGEKAKSLEIGKYLLLGKGEEKTGGRNRVTLLADALEAVIGAVYLEGGLRPVKKFILGFLKEEIERVFHGETGRDHKTFLQEYCQRNFRELPIYRIVKEIGPDHAKRYEVECRIHGEVMGKGHGNNKKEAEQAAAAKALERMGVFFSNHLESSKEGSRT